MADNAIRARSRPAALIVANRAPVEITAGGGCSPAAGGLVSALKEVSRRLETEWIACARTPRERRAARLGAVLRPEAAGPAVHYAPVAAEAYRLHYSVFANPTLWLVHHGLASELPRAYLGRRLRPAWSRGYVAVNRSVARAVARVAAAAAEPPLILLQDYQLELVAGELRRRLRGARVHQFMHIPWPEPREWDALPADVVDRLLEGLLGNESLGFQTAGDAARFLATVAERRPAEVVEAGVVEDGRLTRVVANPISVDPVALRSAAAVPAVRRLREEMRRRLPEHLVLRVDRADPAKNAPLGVAAFARLLAAHPELRGRVAFWCFVQPSRLEIPLYARHLRALRRAVAEVNARFGRPGWQPVLLSEQDDRGLALAAYALYDTLLVNSLADGMNLVAKEGAVLNERDGSLVLSRTAGAHEQLGRWALGVDPRDVQATAAALYASIRMPAAERRARAAGLRAAVLAEDLDTWVERLLAGLPGYDPPRRSAAASRPRAAAARRKASSVRPPSATNPTAASQMIASGTRMPNAAWLGGQATATARAAAIAPSSQRRGRVSGRASTARIQTPSPESTSVAAVRASSRSTRGSSSAR